METTDSLSNTKSRTDAGRAGLHVRRHELANKDRRPNRRPNGGEAALGTRVPATLASMTRSALTYSVNCGCVKRDRVSLHHIPVSTDSPIDRAIHSGTLLALLSCFHMEQRASTGRYWDAVGRSFAHTCGW